MRRLLYRNINARDYLEIFLVTAVSALLINRFFLYLTNYPSVGGSRFHIAHMLYGGGLMLVALVLLFSFLGTRVMRLSAFIGGIGFGLFIDELGKFITRDNNYFFRPTIGLIYAIFIIMYLAFNAISRYGRLTSREYQLNALSELQEAVLQDMDRVEKRRLAELLHAADQSSPITEELQQLLARLEAVPTPEPNRLQRWLKKADRAYARFWRRPNSRTLVGVFFIAQAAVFLAFTVGAFFRTFHDLHSIFAAGDSYDHVLLICQLASTAIASVFAVSGSVQLFRSRRLQALELFRLAVLINLLLTEFFTFARVQFHAMPGFIVNLLLLIGLRYAVAEERRKDA
ncbi:MAG TPA: hypothetical protein VHB72_03295 [Candidatus Saccharimonadales bacterium]|nr:hypothetical protein [Candidatus Saccharimonadales bacterium]